jgi:hypothetical protein
LKLTKPSIMELRSLTPVFGGQGGTRTVRQVFAARDIAEANFIRGLLDSHGLAAAVRSEALQDLSCEVPFPRACPSVWIRDDEDFEAARTLIQQNERTLRVQTCRLWRCLRCGEELEEQFTTCWACGSERSADAEA